MTLALDPRDIRILQILSSEGRLSKSELARRVNLSPSPCWERIKRLEKAGLIKAYRAEVDLARLSAHVVIFVVVELESHRAESFRVFEEAVTKYPEIIECWAIGGGVDYLMQVVTGDINSYQRMIDELLESSVGLKRYFTYIVTKKVKSEPPALDLLLKPQID
ncbi:Lrp/AsnC family transcriptional regulator [Oceanibium sediminis]|uniref:Lrp/AsnC family transcriptional regulator n=1 Tax=Oceanibium sediminis TaxID=2026339 RepID=UPI000DD4AB6B|nr:Lrp/AsnC family transcriptional regulator [Oceanibium sediminis]